LMLNRKYRGRYHYVSLYVFVASGEFSDEQKTDL